MTSFYAQINEDSLTECSDLDRLNFEGGYNLVPLVHPSWKSSESRLLIIVESVDSLDIRNNSLLSGDTVDNSNKKTKFNTHNPMRSIFSSILDKAVSMLRPYGEDVADKFAFGIANFNAKKIRQLPQSEQTPYFSQFTNRVLTIISILKPTHVLVCGDTASHYLLKSLSAPEGTPNHLTGEEVAENSIYKRGWVFNSIHKKHNFLMCPTLDIEGLYNVKSAVEDSSDDDSNDQNDSSATSDLLFFVTRNICNLMSGRMLHDLSGIKAKPIYIDTIEKFDRMMAKLWAAPIIAMDTETANLSSYHNKLYMSQFAISRNSAYVVPVRHPKTPFSQDDIKYMLKQFRKLLLSDKPKTLIFINGQFDLRVYRTQASIPLIPFHRIHEITAGEQSLDENLGLFGRNRFYFAGNYVKTSYQNLRAVFCMYGNDLYFRMAFSKEQRNLTGQLEPDDPDLLKYCSLDAQSIYGIAEEQLLRAYHMYVKPDLSTKMTRYSVYFQKHLHHQMSNTVQGISHMEQHGAHVDVDYLIYMMGKKSPLIEAIKETTKELLDLPTVKEANNKLLKSYNKSTTSLFGGSVNMNLFDTGKKEHKEVLFFDVLQLPVIGYTDTGQRAIDKNFIAAYKETIKEVALFETIVKAGKLLSTYVKGWHKKLSDGLDSSVDNCLRASYGFFTIVTGRLNSFDPSLQQIPSRGKLAKYIKRMFTPPRGRLCIKDDFSSHEVRVWSILSGDKKLAGSFRAGLRLRQELIKLDIEDTKELERVRNELKRKGDSHIQNVFRFFGIWVDKSNPLREAIKAVVFGLLYGSGVRSLAAKIKNKNLRSQLLIEIKEIEKELDQLLLH